MQFVYAFEWNREADAVGVDVIGLGRSGVPCVLVLEPVRRSVQRRRNETAAEEGDEREDSAKLSDRGHSRAARSGRRTRKIRLGCAAPDAI